MGELEGSSAAYPPHDIDYPVGRHARGAEYYVRPYIHEYIVYLPLDTVKRIPRPSSEGCGSTGREAAEMAGTSVEYLW